MVLNRMRLALCLLVVTLAALTGCRKQLPPPPIVAVEGQVTINGQPLPNAEVTFYPVVEGFGPEFIATATTDAQGRYKLTCNGQPGAFACEHRVTVIEEPAPENTRGESARAQQEAAKYFSKLKNRPIPSRYQDLIRTPLLVTVVVGTSQYDLKLERKGNSVD